MRVAIYDLDNTLTRRATFTPFLIFAARRIAPWRLVLLPVWVAMMIGYRAGLYDRTTLKTRGMRTMLGRAELATLEAVGRDFVSQRMESDGLMPATLALLQQDKDRGARIVIATAAFEFYAKAFADRIGIHSVIATRWDGRSIPGGNCYANTKLESVRKWAAEEGLSLQDAELRFVSDSFADAPLLEIASEPIFISASERKRARATSRGWRAIAAD